MLQDPLLLQGLITYSYDILINSFTENYQLAFYLQVEPQPIIKRAAQLIHSSGSIR